jgi:hypothetical protein
MIFAYPLVALWLYIPILTSGQSDLRPFAISFEERLEYAEYGLDLFNIYRVNDMVVMGADPPTAHDAAWLDQNYNWYNPFGTDMSLTMAAGSPVTEAHIEKQQEILAAEPVPGARKVEGGFWIEGLDYCRHFSFDYNEETRLFDLSLTDFNTEETISLSLQTRLTGMWLQNWATSNYGSTIGKRIFEPRRSEAYATIYDIPEGAEIPDVDSYVPRFAVIIDERHGLELIPIEDEEQRIATVQERFDRFLVGSFPVDPEEGLENGYEFRFLSQFDTGTLPLPAPMLRDDFSWPSYTEGQIMAAPDYPVNFVTKRGPYVVGGTKFVAPKGSSYFRFDHWPEDRPAWHPTVWTRDRVFVLPSPSMGNAIVTDAFGENLFVGKANWSSFQYEFVSRWFDRNHELNVGPALIWPNGMAERPIVLERPGYAGTILWARSEDEYVIRWDELTPAYRELAEQWNWQIPPVVDDPQRKTTGESEIVYVNGGESRQLLWSCEFSHIKDVVFISPDRRFVIVETDGYGKNVGRFVAWLSSLGGPVFRNDE